MIRLLRSLLTFLAAVVCLIPAHAQSVPVAGPNINMVSGTTWPNGDPWLQRQNEPSIAVSTRNPLHLFAGSNDYRYVDLSLTISDETGDSWNSIYESFDGGLTWISSAHPGCPQSVAPCNLADVNNQISPLKGLQAATDPTVRAHTHGLFYYSGLAFDRGTNQPSVVFVSRWIDQNNNEGAVTQVNGPNNPIKYLGTAIIDSGTSGQFLDKPWIASDVAGRPWGSANCNILGRAFQTGNAYVIYSNFTGSNTSKIMVARSTNCGASWSSPIKVSESSAMNQGTVAVVDPLTGDLYIAWRRFYQSGTQPDAIMIVKSTDGGQTFTKPTVVATMVAPFGPFDQQTAPSTVQPASLEFRTLAFPTLAIDGSGRVYVAWSQRGYGPSGDARIMMATSPDGLDWTSANAQTPFMLDGNTGRGHQIMPALAFNAGTLTVIWYDLRQDHYVDQLTCPTYPAVPCTQASSFLDMLQPAGELPANPGAVFTPFVDDAGLTLRRHTLDVRVAQASPGRSPSFTNPSQPVSRYVEGFNPSAPNGTLQQLQFNAANLPMFAQGTVPFMGDYLDVAGAPQFVPTVSNGTETWSFNTTRSAAPVFHVAWTDNRDVVPPVDGKWTSYTPVPTQLNPDGTITGLFSCDATGHMGMKNQNIYTARIAPGVLVTAPGNAKPLGLVNGILLQRAFVVVLQNTTNQTNTYHLVIANQPVGGKASFVQFPVLTPPLNDTLDVTIGPLLTASQTVFVTSTDPNASVTVNVFQNGAASGTATLNPSNTNPTITDPVVVGGNNPSILIAEAYNLSPVSPGVVEPGVVEPGVVEPGVVEPGVVEPGVVEPGVVEPGVVEPGVVEPGVVEPGLVEPGVVEPGVVENSVQDSQYTVTNVGNTHAAYNFKMLLNKPLPAGVTSQLLIYKGGTVPQCNNGNSPQMVLIASVNNPGPGSPDATLPLAPGETATAVVRLFNAPANTSVADFLTPSPEPQAANTGAPSITTGSPLPSGQVGSNYSQQLTANGGSGTYVSWSFDPKTLLLVPPGLSINSAGVLSGVLTKVGTYTFLVDVTDSAGKQGSRYLALTVNPAPLIITADNKGMSYGGALPAITASYSGFVNGETAASLTTAPICTTTAMASSPVGSYATTCSGALDANYTITYVPGTLTVNPAGLTITANSANKIYGQTVAFAGTEFTTSGLINGDIVSSVSLTSPGAPAVAAVGPYSLVPSNATGTGLGNYAITYANGTLTVGPAPLTITANNAVKNYGVVAVLPGTAFTANGLMNSDAVGGVTLVSLGAAVSASVGSYPIMPSNATGTGLGNYAITYVNGTLVVGPVPLMITANNQNMLVGEAVPLLTVSYSGFVAGDAAASLTTAPSCITTPTATSSSPAGSYTITCSGAADPNYTISYASGTLTIKTETFKATGSLLTARSFHTATLLPSGPNGGKVLIAGGQDSSGKPLASSELYDPVAGTFSATANNMPNKAVGHTATLLNTGKVLIAGGGNSSAQLYDPATNTFSATSGMSSNRSYHTATLLANGLVLIAGGSGNSGADIATALLYSPATATFASTGSMTSARERHTATLLPDGTVLITGGKNGSTVLKTAEIYNPANGTFSSVGNMTTSRVSHRAVLLSSGLVLIEGGSNGTADLASAEIYNPAAQTFTPATSLVTGAREAHGATLLADGRVLITGGANSGTALNSGEVYSAAGSAFLATATPLVTARSSHTATLLNDGRVLVAGGVGSGGVSITSAEVYTTGP